MAVADSRTRWWALPGEVAAVVDGTKLVFEYDDGTLWGFRLGGSSALGPPLRLVWDHRSESMAAADEGIPSHLRSAAREAFQAMAGTNREWQVSAEGQRILDVAVATLADEEFRGRDVVTGRRLRGILQMDRPPFLRLAAELHPRYLVAATNRDGDYYSPTLPGLLRSARSGQARSVIEAVLAVITGKFRDDQDVSSYSLSEVLAQCKDGVGIAFIINVVSRAFLFHGASGSGSGGVWEYTWGVPTDVEDLVKCRSAEDFLRYIPQTGHEYRLWPTAPKKLDSATVGDAQEGDATLPSEEDRPREPAYHIGAERGSIAPQPNAQFVPRSTPPEASMASHATPLKKYTVFVSSTYKDLKEERKRVTYEVLRAGHIPCGMEQFPAAHDRGWQTITSTIDICDYYVIIVGWRYGEDAPGESISWTEKELDYATSQGMRVLAFIRGRSSDDGKVDTDNAREAKLDALRKKLRSKHHCIEWNTEVDPLAPAAAEIVHW